MRRLEFRTYQLAAVERLLREHGIDVRVVDEQHPGPVTAEELYRALPDLGKRMTVTPVPACKLITNPTGKAVAQWKQEKNRGRRSSR